MRETEIRLRKQTNILHMSFLRSFHFSLFFFYFIGKKGFIPITYDCLFRGRGTTFVLINVSVTFPTPSAFIPSSHLIAFRPCSFPESVAYIRIKVVLLFLGIIIEILIRLRHRTRSSIIYIFPPIFDRKFVSLDYRLLSVLL